MDDMNTSNDSVGYTDDGLVFLLLQSVHEGRPIQIVKTWSIEDVRMVAQNLIAASKAAETKRDERNSQHVN